MSPRTATLAPTVTAHIDGSCDPNPGRGGWGVVLRSGEHEKALSGLVPEETTTNQRAEIYAAIHALSALKEPCKVRVVSDSKYLVETMLGNYRRRTNLDLWEILDDVAAPHAVDWTWVRGHSGEEGNAIG